MRCGQQCDGAIEDAVFALADVGGGEMGGEVGLHADADELRAVGEAVVLGADAGGAAAGESEGEGLAGAAAGGFADDFAAMGLGEDDGHVFGGGEGAWAGEEDDISGEVALGVGREGLGGEGDGRLELTPGAVGGDVPRRDGARQKDRVIQEGGKDVEAYVAVAAAVFPEVEDEGAGCADLGPVFVELDGGGIVSEGVEGDVGDLVGKCAVGEGRSVAWSGFWDGEAVGASCSGRRGGFKRDDVSWRAAEERVLVGASVAVLWARGADVRADFLGCVGRDGLAIDGEEFVADFDTLKIEGGVTDADDKDVSVNRGGCEWGGGRRGWLRAGRRWCGHPGGGRRSAGGRGRSRRWSWWR